MLSFMPYVWIAVMVLAVVLEAITAALVSVWFLPAGLIAMVLSFFKIPIYIQVLVFVLSAGVFLLLSRTLWRKRLFRENDGEATDLDAIIGEKCVVTEKIDNIAGNGQAKIRGQLWAARAMIESETFEVGEIATVVAIEGVRLVCKKCVSAK